MPLAGRSRAAARVEHSEVVCIVSREKLERDCQWCEGNEETGRAYLNGVLAVVDVGKGDFADARPAVRLREMGLDAVSLQRTTSS